METKQEFTMEKVFQPNQVEGRIYEMWEHSGAFQPVKDDFAFRAKAVTGGDWLLYGLSVELCEPPMTDASLAVTVRAGREATFHFRGLNQWQGDHKMGGAGIGNGGYNANPKVWGMNVVESAAVTSGNVIVGAFKAGASVVTQAGNGQRVEVSNSDQDDFIKNMVTVRIEERLVEAVRIPAAFALVGAESS